MKYFRLKTALLFSALFVALIFSNCKKEEDCPKGFTGDDCKQELTPKKVIISSISLTKYPNNKEDGSSWDPLGANSYPDIFLAVGRIDSTGFVLLWNSLITYDLYPNSKLSSSPYPPVELDTDKRYVIAALDFDNLGYGFNEEFIGGISGKFYLPNKGFPSTLNLECDNCTVAFSVEVSYAF